MWHFLFGFHGRLSRSSFCFFAAIAFIALLALLSALYLYEISAGNYENGGPVPWPSTPLGIVGAATWFLCLLTILVAFLGVSAKRLHDRDRSVWWLIVFLLVPDVFYALGQYLQDNGPANLSALAALCQLLAIGFFAWGFVELACLRGTPGSNRFGSDPLMRAG